MGGLQTYDLRCELFEYSHERLDTGVEIIDALETSLSGDNFANEGIIVFLEDGSTLVTESVDTVVLDNDLLISTNDKNADNNEFSTNNLDFIDFSEMNPFSEGDM